MFKDGANRRNGMFLQESLQLVWVGTNVRGVVNVHRVRIVLVPFKDQKSHISVAEL